MNLIEDENLCPHQHNEHVISIPISTNSHCTRFLLFILIILTGDCVYCISQFEGYPPIVSINLSIATNLTNNKLLAGLTCLVSCPVSATVVCVARCLSWCWTMQGRSQGLSALLTLWQHQHQKVGGGHQERGTMGNRPPRPLPISLRI